MGVSGSGKSTIGRLLARALGWPYLEADDFHPPANIAKMSRGIPLDDQDRMPWLRAIRAAIDELLARGHSAVVTASALKESHRHVLTDGLPAVHLVHLTGAPDTILGRLEQRTGHFMTADMLRSQLDILEPPEDALTIDIADSPADIVAIIRHELGL